MEFITTPLTLKRNAILETSKTIFLKEKDSCTFAMDLITKELFRKGNTMGMENSRRKIRLHIWEGSSMAAWRERD